MDNEDLLCPDIGTKGETIKIIPLSRFLTTKGSVTLKGQSNRHPGHEQRMQGHIKRIYGKKCLCRSGKAYGKCCLVDYKQERNEMKVNPLVRVD